MSEDVLARPFRPLPIRAMNAIGRGLARIGVVPISLVDEDLMEAARRATGLDDFGPDTFRPGLAKLLESIEVDARLTLFGRYFARRQMLELLSHRLCLTDYRKRHPEVAREVIRRPLFILGLPRTGTTLLYGLLAEDPSNRAPLSWEIDDPCPPAEAETYDSDPRIARTQKRFDQVGRLAPGFQTIHPVGALMPQECIVPTASEFMSIRFEMTFDVESYDEWLLRQDMTATYAHHRRFLQHMQSRYMLERWILKSPGHLGPIDTLFETYPDAMVVQTHRDPIRVIPSVANLEYTMRLVASDEVDPARIGRQMIHVWSTLLEQGMEARARHPEREAQILDLSMREIVTDPIGCVERIYAHFDLSLSEEARRRMERYLERHPKNEFGIHRYSLEAFGLEEEAVNAAFKGYRERFDIDPEPFDPS
ncbi:MAG TPA: sulfotransferase [Deltaproteobacteria bacterium]|nr:sulfotransferase [Deltaproteobacteria bacterium]